MRSHYPTGNEMEYQGYKAAVAYSEDDKVFHGRIAGINDIITFEATTVARLERAFREAVIDYLEACKQFGKKPDREYSGKIPLRIDPELHRALAIEAEAKGESLNSWLLNTLRRVAG